MRIAVLWVAAAIASQVFCSAAFAQRPTVPDPIFPLTFRALFETPTETLRVEVPAQVTGGAPGVVRCFRYPSFTVQEVDFGEHGDQSIFVTAHDKTGGLPVCGPVSGRVEKTLFDGDESYFVGVKGPFGFVVSTNGQDGTPFMIHNLTENRALYRDEIASGTFPSEVGLQGNVLRLDYVRAAKGSCSIIRGGAACWKAFAAEAELPRAIADAPPPVRLCQSGYAAVGKEGNADEASVLSYRLRVEIDAAVEVEKVRTIGALVSCKPRS